jgi:hypothetical protein
MFPFGVTIPVTVPQRSEIPEGLMNNPVYTAWFNFKKPTFSTLVFVLLVLITKNSNVILFEIVLFV